MAGSQDTHLCSVHSGRNKKPNRTGRIEPNESNRLILEPAGTGRGNEPNRSGPSQDAPEKRRPNRIEPGKLVFRTEPNRTEPVIVRTIRNRNESNQTGSFLRKAKLDICLQGALRATNSHRCVYLSECREEVQGVGREEEGRGKERGARRKLNSSQERLSSTSACRAHILLALISFAHPGHLLI